jgi:signal transduction histidine kinase
MRAANRAGEITDQLLRFSRQQALQMVAVEVTQVLEEALLLVEPDARKRGVSIDRRIEPAVPFLADGHALHQVFLNLLTNALQAMPGGGTLGVKAETSGQDLVVHFQDTGVGIPDGHLDRVFEPFFTTKDQDPDPAIRGSGLGLAVSYSIVEAHGGSLEVESEESRGSIFTVRLPMAAPPSKEDAHG